MNFKEIPFKFTIRAIASSRSNFYVILRRGGARGGFGFGGRLQGRWGEGSIFFSFNGHLTLKSLGNVI